MCYWFVIIIIIIYKIHLINYEILYYLSNVWRGLTIDNWEFKSDLIKSLCENFSTLYRREYAFRSRDTLRQKK